VFVKGKSGNPAGRTPGSKNKFRDKFWHDLYDVWEQHGAKALLSAVNKNPLGFCQMCASMLPKEEHVTHEIRAVRLWTETESLAYLTSRESNSEPITIEHNDMQSLSATDERVKH
jgi:hypothetical protein